MADVKHRPASHIVDGLQVPVMFPSENVRSAIDYKPYPDDVILVTYPKCGSTWSQHILSLIFRKGAPMLATMESFGASPFLEMTGADAARDMPRPGVIKVHLPYHLTPYSPDAKYVYVTRNPKDCCVSYFHHMKNIAGYHFDGSFDEFFELFISGNIDYGDYFDHFLEWYDHRNDPNVLFVTYEEMKADTKAAVMKFASFLGKEYADLLNENPKVLEDILHYSSFGYMKEKVNEDFNRLHEMDEESIRNASHIPEGLKPTFLKMIETGKQLEGKKPVNNFIRKGIVGDWRNHLSPEQNKRMDEKISQRLKGNELLEIWKNYM